VDPAVSRRACKVSASEQLECVARPAGNSRRLLGACLFRQALRAVMPHNNK
jgi:hypothetical protein